MQYFNNFISQSGTINGDHFRLHQTIFDILNNPETHHLDGWVTILRHFRLITPASVGRFAGFLLGNQSSDS